MIHTLKELLERDGKLWVVIVVIGIVLVGWSFDLFRTGRRVKKAEKRLKR
jgi:hypothetical protein